MANVKISELSTAVTVTDDDYLIIDNGVETRKLKVKNAVTFPVGYIYMSVDSTNPSTYFGGTWEQLQDRFLLGAGSTYSAGSTGGEANHTLTVDEMPSHNHSYTDRNNGDASTNRVTLSGDSNKNLTATSGSYTTGNRGGGQAHNNMPPYLVVYMWKRTA